MRRSPARASAVAGAGLRETQAVGDRTGDVASLNQE